MSKESGEGDWMQLKGKPNEKRGKRSDDDPRVDDRKKAGQACRTSPETLRRHP